MYTHSADNLHGRKHYRADGLRPPLLAIYCSGPPTSLKGVDAYGYGAGGTVRNWSCKWTHRFTPIVSLKRWRVVYSSSQVKDEHTTLLHTNTPHEYTRMQLLVKCIQRKTANWMTTVDKLINNDNKLTQAEKQPKTSLSLKSISKAAKLQPLKKSSQVFD